MVLNSFDFEILFYGRYVNDTFLIVPFNKIQQIFDQYHPRINFTMELEKDSKLNFLDISVHRDVDGGISTNWYRKPTYSGRVLNYLSDHPCQHKIGIIKSLNDNAVKLTHKKFHAKNLKYVKEMLLLNN